MTKMKVILERFPYRFVQKGLLEINGEPDYRIQTVSYTHLTLPTTPYV